MKILYFGLPFGYDYDWTLGDDVEQILSLKLGHPVKFICNSAVYKGDAYSIEVEPEEELIFTIKFGFDRINPNKVKEYLFKKNISC